MVNAAFITFMNIVYKKVAVWLTGFENHRTDTQFEDALILKVFLFQFVNSYISLFYIAFLKPYRVTIFGVQADECRNSCLDELSTQLLSLVVIMQFVNNGKELLMPVILGKAKAWWAARKMRKMKRAGHEPKPVQPLTRFEDEADMEPYISTFDDYNELAIQFGYVTLFAAAFPIASFASLLNNIMEIRSDAFKILTGMRRPPYMGAEDIGSWQKVFEAIGTLSVITNVCIIGFTSLYLAGKCEMLEDFPPNCADSDCDYFKGDSFRASHTGFESSHLEGVIVDCSLRTRSPVCCPVIMSNGVNIVREIGTTWFLEPFQVLVVVVLCEHAILFLRQLLDEFIPDMPGWIEKAKARREVIKEALEREKQEAELKAKSMEAYHARKQSFLWKDDAAASRDYITDDVHDYRPRPEDFVEQKK